MRRGGRRGRTRIRFSQLIALPRPTSKAAPWTDITATIRREKVKYVGILASDPQDTVFLVERIKAGCPGVQIFVTEMDLTYALPDNRRVMRGVVISTTYPLYPPNQGWTGPTDNH